MHEVLVNRLGGLSLPRKSVVRLTDRPDMTLDVYRGRKTTIQPTNQSIDNFAFFNVAAYLTCSYEWDHQVNFNTFNIAYLSKFVVNVTLIRMFL